MYAVVIVEDGAGEFGGAWASVRLHASRAGAVAELRHVVRDEWQAEVLDRGEAKSLADAPGYRFPRDMSVKRCDTYMEDDFSRAWYDCGGGCIRKVEVVEMVDGKGAMQI